MILKTFKTALIVGILGLGLVASVDAGTINLVSGQGTIGGTDSAVSYLAAPTSGPIVPATFNLASYTAATVVTPNPNWISASAFNSAVGSGSAQWDSTSQAAVSTPPYTPYSATYAINIGTSAGLGSGLQTATLSGFFSVDDFISAIYVNGQLVPGSSYGGNFSSANTLPSLNILPYINASSQNTLYIVDNNNIANTPAGLIFNLTVTTSTVPEPSSIAMVSIAGLVGLGAFVRRKRSIA